jgi:hypothetical protein
MINFSDELAVEKFTRKQKKGIMPYHLTLDGAHLKDEHKGFHLGMDSQFDYFHTLVGNSPLSVLICLPRPWKMQRRMSSLITCPYTFPAGKAADPIQEQCCCLCQIQLDSTSVLDWRRSLQGTCGRLQWTRLTNACCVTMTKSQRSWEYIREIHPLLQGW